MDPSDAAESTPVTATVYNVMEKSIIGLKAEQELWKDEILKLRNENLQLQSKFEDLTKMLQIRVRDWSMLSAENSSLHEKMKQAEDNTKAMENEMQRLREENNSLKRTSAELRYRNSELIREVEAKGEEIVALQKIEVDSSSQGIDVAQGQRGKLEEQVLVMTKHISKSKVVMETLESRLTSKICAKIKTLNKQKETLDKLVVGLKHNKIENARRMESKDETIRKLAATSAERERECESLLEKLEQSETEKTDAVKEVGNLRELVQTLEVHLKLLNQKFKITKSEHKEKEEMSQKRIRDLQEKCRRLEEHYDGLCEDIRYAEIELEQIKEVAEMGLTSLGESFERLESEFEEKSELVGARISRCHEGFLSLKGAASSKLEEEFERRELMVRSMYQDEMISMMREERGDLAARLEKEEEERRLAMIARDYERKMREVAEERANGERREVVRRLCKLMAYYRENCDGFLSNLSVKLKQIKPFR